MDKLTDYSYNYSYHYVPGPSHTQTEEYAEVPCKHCGEKKLVWIDYYTTKDDVFVCKYVCDNCGKRQTVRT